MQLLLNRIATCAKVALMAFALSSTALAAPGDAIMAAGKSDGFNHAHTGYQLSGAHAVAVCETCHTGGVFEGTPQRCEGCHTVGSRVAATPMSTEHIVTTAACDSCHFNTVSFLGAKFNHSMAIPGGCDTCHNGRTQEGRPSSHSSGSRLTASCDSCHRTTAWLPATWNHGPETIGQCKSCHENSSLVSSQNVKPAGHTTVSKSTYQCDECHNVFGWLPAKYKHKGGQVCASCHNHIVALGKPTNHTPASIKGINACDDCHTQAAWIPAAFKHNTIGGQLCSSCHDHVKSIGKPGSHTPTSIKGMNECNDCHTTSAWSPAAFKHNTIGGQLCSSCHDHVKSIGKPGSHTPTSIKGMNECNDCHTTSAWSPAAFKHNNIGGQLCSSCHDHTKAIGAPGDHIGFPGWPLECNQCHLNTTSFSGALGAKPANHIPYNSGVLCTNCHIGAGTVARGRTMHVNVNTFNCFTCHGSGTLYRGNRQRIAPWPNYHERGRNPAATDCSDSGCHRPKGRTGSAYNAWD